MARDERREILEIIEEKGRATQRQVCNQMDLGWIPWLGSESVRMQLEDLARAGLLVRISRRIPRYGGRVDVYLITDQGSGHLEYLRHKSRMERLGRERPQLDADKARAAGQPLAAE